MIGPLAYFHEAFNVRSGDEVIVGVKLRRLAAARTVAPSAGLVAFHLLRYVTPSPRLHNSVA